MSKFKVGDRVRRINENYCEAIVGEIYTVKEIKPITQIIGLSEIGNMYKIENFELANEEPKMKVSQETIAAFLHACEHGVESIECWGIDWQPIGEISLRSLLVRGLKLRIKPEPEIDDYIDWSQVSPDFIAMARDKNGKPYLYNHIPLIEYTRFENKDRAIFASVFTSYKEGNKPWHQSLVKRPV